MWWMPLIGAGMGLLQGAQKDKQAQEQMKMQAMQNRYAPLFNQAPGRMQIGQTSNVMGDTLSGALGGYQTGMNMKMMENALGLSDIGNASSTGNDVAMNMGQQRNPYQVSNPWANPGSILANPGTMQA